MDSGLARSIGNATDFQKVLASLLVVAVFFGGLPIGLASPRMEPDCSTSSSPTGHAGCCGDNASMAHCNADCMMTFAAALGASTSPSQFMPACLPSERCPYAVRSVASPPDPAPPKAFSA
jgi:hypothetical protein